jgi:phospholipid/cholesterol/gamma-HCH transport system ATP-binding protein
MTEPILECRDLTCGYEDATPVLEHVDLTIGRNEIVALLGGSGCGKSTLMRTISGLRPPLSGEVLLFGEPLYGQSVASRNVLLRRIGVAFQQDALFSSMSIEANVGLPLRELTRLSERVIREMVKMRLMLVGLEGLDHRLPGHLSGGQRKRAALARASIMDPELIFCDEPTAGLDPVVAAGIDETLMKFRDVLGTAIVVVSHELESIRATADRAVMFAGGTIAASGTVDELANSSDQEIHNFFHARTG